MKRHCTNSYLFCNYFGYICNSLIASIRACNYDNIIICGSYEIVGLQTNLNTFCYAIDVNSTTAWNCNCVLFSKPFRREKNSSNYQIDH